MSEEKTQKKTALEKKVDSVAADLRRFKAKVDRIIKTAETQLGWDIDGDSEIGGSAKRQLLVVLLGCACIAAIAYGATVAGYIATESEDAVISLAADDADDTLDTWTIEVEASGNDFTLNNGSGTEVFNLDTSGNLQIDGTLTSAGGSTFGDLTCDDLTVNSNAVVTGTTDLNGAVTSTNITMDTGSTLAANILTVGGTADFNAAITATNITTDAGSTVTLNSAVDINSTLTTTDITVDVGSPTVLGGTLDVNGATTATNITMDTGSTLAANILTVGGTADFNAAASFTNITTDSGSTSTFNGGADFNAAISCTNLTTDAGSTATFNGTIDANAAASMTNLTLVAGATYDGGDNNHTNIGIISADALQPDGAALTLDTGTGEATIDGKYAAVGPDATTPLMILQAAITAPNQTTQTNTFATAFGAAPIVTCTYTENPGDVRPLFVTSVSTTNFVANITADMNYGYIAVGQRP
jgi:cytoskeletal protein CcmA (bactofilin family)